MVKKRYPKLLRIQALFIVFIYLLSFPLMTLDVASLDQFQGITQQVIARLNISIYPFCTLGQILICSWRFFHIYYDLKYSSSQKNSEWKYHLDPDLVQNNFWLTHKKTFGSTTYTQRPIMIFYITNVILIISLSHITLNTNYTFITGFISLFIHALCYIPLVVIWFKLPEFSDDFFIKVEMQVLVVSIVLITIFCCCIVLITTFIGHSLMLLAAVFTGIMGVFVIAASSFWWIPKQIRGKELELNMSEHLQLDIIVGTDSSINQQPIALVSHKSQDSAHPKPYKLYSVLSEPHAFKIFMQHLAHELSTVCLLCFVEIAEYKCAMQERFRIVDDNAIKDEGIAIPLHDIVAVVPKSMIIRNGFEQNIAFYRTSMDREGLVVEAKKVCLELYKKYIDIGSEMEVNISYKKRQELIHLMKDTAWWLDFNINPNELFCLYDDVASEMFALMDGSYMRFRQKPMCQTVVSILDKSCIISI